MTNATKIKTGTKRYGNELFATPTVPYSLTDAVNRMALATGSYAGAMAGGSADYNGKRVRVDTGIRAGWRAHYTWAGLNWITRGATFDAALAAAFRDPSAKAKGGRVEVALSDYAKRDEHMANDELREKIAAAGLLPAEEAEAIDATWKDWRFAEVNAALDWDKRWGAGVVALLLTMTAEQTRKDFTDARTALMDRRRKGGKR